MSVSVKMAFEQRRFFSNRYIFSEYEMHPFIFVVACLKKLRGIENKIRIRLRTRSAGKFRCCRHYRIIESSAVILIGYCRGKGADLFRAETRKLYAQCFGIGQSIFFRFVIFIRNPDFHIVFIKLFADSESSLWHADNLDF